VRSPFDPLTGTTIMTYQTYSQQALSRYTLPRLKRIAAELGVKPTGDKRAADTWVNAIITHQSAQLEKIDEQALSFLQGHSTVVGYWQNDGSGDGSGFLAGWN
jgi:hypothetical protein